jgi:hypothetical protein
MILAVSPENGVGGVASDVQIAIVFSEPMDPTTTQSAWHSLDIGGATFSWNDDDTELTIAPTEALVYASGANVDTVDARHYSFTLAATATDKAGNALEGSLASSFFTLRVIHLQVPPIDALTGMSHTPDTIINTSNVYVGDTQYDLQQKGVLSFMLPALPPAALGVFQASISADQTSCGGSPYGLLPALGQIHIMDVEFATAWDSWEASATADLGEFSDDAALETKTFDVTQAVIDDYDADNVNTQFRLEFPTATNGDAVLDRCTFSKPTVGMELSYLIE